MESHSFIDFAINILILAALITLIQMGFNSLYRLFFAENPNRLQRAQRPRRAATPRPANRNPQNRSLTRAQFRRISSPATAEMTGTCAVCLGDMNESQSLRKLVCNHVYHEQCIFNWITRQEATCPICRRNVRNSY